MGIEQLIILGLATWRVTSIINQESIFEGFRKLLGIRVEANTGLIVYERDNFLTNMVACFWCLSVWVAIGIFVINYYVPEIPYIFAVSSVALITNKKVF